MLWMFLLSFKLHDAVDVGENYTPLCYNVLGSEKNIRMYANKDTNFFYENLKLKIDLWNDREDFYDTVGTNYDLYLKLIKNDCQFEKLQFAKLDDNKKSWTDIEIKIETSDLNKLKIDSFKIKLLQDYEFGEVTIIGKNEIFGMIVESVKTPVLLNTSYIPDMNQNKLPKLTRNQYYCLKFLKKKLGKFFIDKFRPTEELSNIEKYVSVEFKITYESKDNLYEQMYKQSELAQLSICEDICLNPFEILINSTEKNQRIEIDIITMGDILKKSYKYTEGEGVKVINDNNIWEPYWFLLTSQTNPEKNSNTPWVQYILFKSEPFWHYCGTQKNFDLIERLAEDVVLEMTTYGVDNAPNLKGVMIGRKMTDEEIKQCKISESSPK